MPGPDVSTSLNPRRRPLAQGPTTGQHAESKVLGSGQSHGVSRHKNLKDLCGRGGSKIVRGRGGG